MFLLGFPRSSVFGKESLVGSGTGTPTNRPVHRIIRMAFDFGGHFAFITNKLEVKRLSARYFVSNYELQSTINVK